jgi:membrane protease YdiL (CAAX protease family)
LNRALAGLHPRRFFHTLAAIDSAAAAERNTSVADAHRPGRRAAVVLLSAAVCLLLLHYLKFATAFRAFLQLIDGLSGYPADTGYRQLQATGFLPLLSYCWWGFWHLLCYVCIPLLVIKTVLREPLREYGIRARGLRSHFCWYALLCAPILGFVMIAGLREDFLAQYPFYRQAGRSGFDLLVWEALYLSQFIFLEFFFRGFVLYGCKTAFGANAILVMALPYLMIHFAKPWPEAAGALLFGIFLGVLALRSGSIWGGVLVHITIAFSMDLTALLRSGGLPGHWWPS